MLIAYAHQNIIVQNIYIGTAQPGIITQRIEKQAKNVNINRRLNPIVTWMERCYISLVIKKTQNKMTVKCHFIFIRLAKLSKNETILKIGEDVE